MNKLVFGALLLSGMILAVFVFAHKPKPAHLVKSVAAAPPPIRKKPKAAIRKIDSTERVDTTSLHIYLSFDDGPYKTTHYVRSVLDSEGVRSSFMIVGKQVYWSDHYRQLYDSLEADSNVRLYNHTYTHGINQLGVHNYYKEPQQVLEDIRCNRDTLGLSLPITRLPGVNAWYTAGYKHHYSPEALPLFHLLDSLHSRENIIGWDLEWGFKGMQKPDVLYRQVIEAANSSKVRNHVVLLMHDFQFDNNARAQGLDTVIRKLKTIPGVRFHWLEEHPLVRGYAVARVARRD